MSDSVSTTPQKEFKPESRTSANLVDLLIRASLIGGLAILCYQVFAPFLPLMAWSIILAVMLYPLHQKFARVVRNKQWLASLIVLLIGFLIIIIPTALLMNSFADSVRGFISSVQNNTLDIPAPSEKVAQWPIVGKKVYALWAKADTDLPGLVQSMQPKIGNLARASLAMVAKLGGGLLLFLGSFILASIIMAYGEEGSESFYEIFQRLAGPSRGHTLADLCTSTIRAVALGVVGVAFIQAILIGLALLIAKVPSAGLLSVIALILGIAQIPALLITLPAIIYIWSSGAYSSGAAIAYTIILLLTSLADNVLKPLMLGRGVKVPMPVILLGALGGMASGGILGMFVGAMVLALGYEIFKGWVAMNSDANPLVVSEPVKTAQNPT
jgi:predicted PurR-regulated permease PerM